MIEKRLAASQLVFSHILPCCCHPCQREASCKLQKQRLEELIPSLCRGSSTPSSPPLPCCGHISGPSQGACGRGVGAGKRLCWGSAHPADLLGQLVPQRLPSPACRGSSAACPASLCHVPPSKGKAKRWSLQGNQGYWRHSRAQEGVKCRWMEDPGEWDRARGDVPVSRLRLGQRGAQAVGAGTGVPASPCPAQPWASLNRHGATPQAAVSLY